MKYRNKPVIIEAMLVQVSYKNLKDIIEFVGPDKVCPIERRPDYVLKIKTLVGNMAVGFGDYIIKDTKGEFCPIKAPLFEETYELIEEEPTNA